MFGCGCHEWSHVKVDPNLIIKRISCRTRPNHFAKVIYVLCFCSCCLVCLSDCFFLRIYIVIVWKKDIGPVFFMGFFSFIVF